jgi:hypothetical protein
MQKPERFVAAIAVVAVHVLANILSLAIPLRSGPNRLVPPGLWMGEVALLGLWLGLGAGSWGWRIALVHIAVEVLAATCVFVFQLSFDGAMAFIFCPAIANALGALAMRRLGCLDPLLG